VRKVVHGGALSQPGIATAGDYDAIIAADVNDAWYPPSPRVLEAIAEWAPRAHHSPDTSCRRLIDALAQKFQLERDAIRIGAGSSDLLHHTILSLLRPGDELLTLEPTYAEYGYAARLAGAEVRTIVLDPDTQFVAGPDRILEEVSRSPRLLAICNPNNPTGSVIPRSDLLRIAAASPNTMVLVDEAYIDFCPQDSVLGDVQDHPNLAVVRTFSKAYAMAGLRVGFAALGADLREQFDHRGRPPWPVNLLGLRAAEAALADDDYLALRITECLRLKNELQAALLISTIPSVTHYFILDLAPTRLNASHLLEQLRSERVFLRDFSGFSDQWPDRFLRVTVQSPTNTALISSLINKLLE
jgi:histidinol-phosphate aminotransferase